MSQLIREIAARKRAEQALRESEERCREISETISDFAYAFRVEADGQLHREWVAGALVEITGFTVDELAARGGWPSLIHPPDMPGVLDQLRCLLAAKPNVAEYRIVSKSGEIRWMLDCGRPVWDEAQGRVTHVYGAVQDITARKRTEEALAASERKYRELVEGTEDLVARIDPDGVITYVNHSAERIFGVPAPESLGRSFFDFVHPEDRSHTQTAFNGWIAQRRKSVTFENRQLSRTGPVHHMLWTISIHYGENGDVVDLSGIARDITERIRAERELRKIEGQLRQAQKLEAVGTLAGGIAHDFNNMLGAIIGYSELAALDLPADHPGHHSVQNVLAAAERAKDLVQQILAFSRSSDEQRTPLSLHVVVKEALKLIRSSLPSTIEIRENIVNDRDTVIADPTGMHQIVMNLCTNAYQAMRERGGTLEVALEVADRNGPLIATTGHLDPGTYIRLAVRDTGTGIRTPVIERIFEPYYTTKPRGEGTGLGLAVVHGIVANHGGAIAVESEPGRGTAFSIYLPRVDRETIRDAEPEGELPRGTEHVLFLDDEEALTQVGGRMLQSLGYRVMTMSDSAQALQAFRDDPQQFDVVVTDQTMPGITGADLAVELMTIRPDVPIVLCTGFSELIGPKKAHELGIRGFIKKPFSRGQLAKAVREALPNAPN